MWKVTPSWLVWLHYSAFYFLYPPGFIIEMAIWYNVLPYIRDMGLYNIRAPAPYDNYNIFNYYYGMCLYLVWQIYSFPFFYLELHNNRKAVFERQRKKLE